MENKRVEFIYNNLKIYDDTDIDYEFDLNPNSFKVIKDGEDSLFIGYDPILGKQFLLCIIEEKRIRLTDTTFNLLIGADPTKKCLYLQWLCKIIIKLIKNKDYEYVNKIITEDLSMINESLTLFNDLKKTKKFKELSLKNISLSHLKDPIDINQYSIPEELHDSVFPFKENDKDSLRLKLDLLVNNNEGKISFEDKNFLVFIPLSLNASTTFYNMATWCTTRPENGMFDFYTNKKRQPNGKKSNLYVILNKITHELYQIHFESNQINNERNRYDSKTFITNFLNKSIGLNNYFKQILSESLSLSKFNPNSIYMKSITNLNFIDIIINLYPDDITSLNFSDSNVMNLKIKEFNKLKILKLTNLKLINAPEMFYSKELEIISLHKNSLTEFPEEFLSLKKLKSINLSYNNITDVPEDIKYLDPSYNGSLINLSLLGNPISETKIKRLKQILPNVNIVS